MTLEIYLKKRGQGDKALNKIISVSNLEYQIYEEINLC